jgi:adenine phosphoribosyltransferase
MTWQNLIRAVPDFPKAGIVFRDITPLCEDGTAFAQVIDSLAARYKNRHVDKILGIESRGFLLAAPLAYALQAGLVLVRKKGKLPRSVHTAEYDLEYGSDSLHMHRDALRAGDRVLIVDDVLATGGTAHAAITLAQQAGAAVEEVAVLIELEALAGRGKLAPHAVHSLVSY